MSADVRAVLHFGGDVVRRRLLMIPAGDGVFPISRVTLLRGFAPGRAGRISDAEPGAAVGRQGLGLPGGLPDNAEVSARKHRT